MSSKTPYQIIKHQYVTEKSTMLSQLKDSESSASLRRCKSPKYVFIVDPHANKIEIAQALEEIYRERNIKVVAVNTLNVKPKLKGRRRAGRQGKTAGFKKAIVTFEVGDSLDDV